MASEITFFGSLSSAYCYFALDRVARMARDLDLRTELRPVLPGVIRLPESYAGRSAMELAYFERDVVRTAEFLGLPYGAPEPSPVDWVEGWVAAPQQRRLFRLYNMLFEAHRRARGYELYAALMRLIWSGATPGWDEDAPLGACLEACGLPDGLLRAEPALSAAAEEYFAANREAMYACGHWGVPLFCWQGEPFYGQDRLDQLRWRVEGAEV
ncbi:MAG: DsbA family protein [Rhodospirillales bacterium]|nr:MAG: DsbA family protein [Rhodospirillales bacterium]